MIHFNWGLHDLKKKGTQVPIEEYEKNLRELVRRMKATKAKLICATTTPVGKRAARRQEDVKRYNAVARKVMAEEGVPVDDLYALARPQLDRIQKKDNVHFEDAGCEALAGAVARSIVAVLAGRKTWTPSAVTFAGTLEVTRNAKDEIASATLTDAAGETYRLVLDEKGKELAAKLADRKVAVTGTVTIRNPDEQAAEHPLETMWLTVRKHRPVEAGKAQ